MSSTLAPPSRPRRSARLALLGLATLGGVLWGFSVLFRYSWTPGPSDGVPARWPAPAGVELAADRPTLLLFVHPRCPCTRATVGELDRIAARCGDRVAMSAFFRDEPELAEDAARGELWRTAASIPGLVVREDREGRIASRFAVQTSGHVLLYGVDGRLLFEGGITGSRGHAGDNPGEESVVRSILDGAPTCASTPVYGCLLGSPDVPPEEELSP